MVVALVDSNESEIRKAWESNDFDAAMTRAFERYSDELYGFLRGLGRDEAQADDAFSAMCERIWKGLPKFRWDSSFRVWAYRIARNEFLRTTRDVTRARKAVPLSQIPSVQRIIAARSTTPLHHRDDVKDKFAEARAQLPPDDLVLLGMRIEHKMPWDQIALVLAGDDAEPPTTAEVAALRKRFERLKTKLRDLVRDD